MAAGHPDRDIMNGNNSLMRVISLTSIPPRFAFIGPTLECLIDQGADEVRLHIPRTYRRFADWDGQLPDVPRGVKIVRCDADFGPATKVLPACRDLRGTNAQILFCDDDCVVPRGWAKRLFDIQERRRCEAVAVYVRSVEGYILKKVKGSRPRAWQLPIKYDVAYRASRLAAKVLGTRTLRRRPFLLPGYGDIFFGVGGVVVRPEFLDDRAFDVPDVAWLVDDIWLSANLARKKIPIYCPWMASLPDALETSKIESLLDTSFSGKERQELNRAAAAHCRDAFGIWI